MKKLLIGIIISFCAISCGENVLSSSDGNSSSSGTNGSYSQIIVDGDYLYGIVGNQISTLNISDKENVEQVDTQILAFDIESIFIDDRTLFVGSASRFYIFILDSDTGIPTPLSEQSYNIDFLEDQLICFNDPIIADANYAYVTLWATISNTCRTEQINELRVYDITDLTAPLLISTSQMEQPKGLAKDGNTLFVCDGFNGLKIFDITDPMTPIERYHFDGFDSYDVIARNDLLQVVAEDRLLQFDYSDLDNIFLLGTLNL